MNVLQIIGTLHQEKDVTPVSVISQEVTLSSVISSMDNVTANLDMEDDDVMNVKPITGEILESSVSHVPAVRLVLRVLSVTEPMGLAFVCQECQETSVTNVLEDSLETLLTVLLAANASKTGMS